MSSNLRSRSGNDNVFVELGDMQVKGGLTGNAANWGNVCSLFNLEAARGRWIDIVINTNFGTGPGGYLDPYSLTSGTNNCAQSPRCGGSQN